MECDGHSVSVSASIGIALYPEHGEDAETLLHHADQAMLKLQLFMQSGHGIHLQPGSELQECRDLLQSGL